MRPAGKARPGRSAAAGGGVGGRALRGPELRPARVPCLRRYAADSLNVTGPAEVNLFETTIRVLGGLLSAQHLAADAHPGLAQRLAEKAAGLGARLLAAFRSPSGEELRGAHPERPAEKARSLLA